MPFPKRFFCFMWHRADGGMNDFVGSSALLVDAVKIIRNHDDYEICNRCEIWDIYNDQLIMNKAHIEKYILEPFKLKQ